MTRPPRRPSPLAFVTVVRNDREGLAATLESLRGQTWQGFDWIVVDGASDDGTAGWLAAHGSEATWWCSAPDRGLYDAMNTALDHTTADAVLFLNAGDTLAEADTAASLREALSAAPAAGLIYGDALERMTDGTIRLKPARHHRTAGCGMFTHHQAMVFRRSLAPGQRFDARFPIGADYAFTLATLATGAPAVRLARPVCVFAPAGESARRARQGRADQARIRREMLGHGPIRCGAIRTLQAVAQAVRDHLPRVYTHMRFGKPPRTFFSRSTLDTSATNC